MVVGGGLPTVKWAFEMMIATKTLGALPVRSYSGVQKLPAVGSRAHSCGGDDSLASPWPLYLTRIVLQCEPVEEEVRRRFPFASSLSRHVGHSSESWGLVNVGEMRDLGREREREYSPTL